MPALPSRSRRPRPTSVGWIGAVALTAALVVGLSSCGGGTKDEANAAPDLALGQQRYAQRCAMCHGADLRGTGIGPSHLSVAFGPEQASDAMFADTIRNGGKSSRFPQFDRMPAVPGLSDHEITSIIAYVRSQQQAQGLTT